MNVKMIQQQGAVRGDSKVASSVHHITSFKSNQLFLFKNQ